MEKNYMTRTGLKRFPVWARFAFRYWCRCLAFLCFILIGTSFAHSQIVTQGASVQANFGIDGDLYANYSWSPGIAYVGVDDWFVSDSIFNIPYPGPGLGVIDQSKQDSLIAACAADKNASFTLRMSMERNTQVGDITWIDAVYYRDWNATQGRVDYLTFTTTQDKNGDNPKTWNVGEHGVPQKNDLIDVMGFMCMDTTTDELWGMGAFSTISPDGNSHADYEFFANSDVHYNGVDSLLGTGDEGGHTAWQFGPEGQVLSAGDLIVSIDYTKGGTNPVGHVRVWISDADYAFLMTMPDSLEFELTGPYDSGEDADGWGYADIQPVGGGNDPSVYAVINITTPPDPPAPPWGTQLGSQATQNDYYEQYQFTEFAINLTHLGLDAFGGDACNKRLGSLIVKTRSSSSFTAELKDLAGPFLFGFELITGVEVQNLSDCENGDDTQEFNLNDAVTDSHNGNIFFYDNSAAAYLGGAGLDTMQTVNVGDTMFWVRSENKKDPLCFAVDSFTITVHNNPECTVVTTDETHYLAFDGTATVIVNGGMPPYTFEWTAGGGGFVPDSVKNDSILTVLSGGSGAPGYGVYYVTVIDSFGCETSCNDTIRWTPTAPTCQAYSINIDCFGAANGVVWAEITPNPNGAYPPYSYYWTKNGAPFDTTITASLTDTLYGLEPGIYSVEVYDSFDPNGSGCGAEVTQPDYNPVFVECSNITVESCLSQTEIETDFLNWLDTVFFVHGGTDPLDTIYKVDGIIVDLDTINEPDKCGGSITIEMIVSDYCELSDTCFATFTVPTPEHVDVVGPGMVNKSSCDFADQVDLDTTFANWLAEFKVTNDGGCGAQGVGTAGLNPPILCVGDTINVVYTIDDGCTTDTARATFGVSGVLDLVVSDPSSEYHSSCEYSDQSGVESDFDDWFDAITLAIQTQVDLQGCDPQVSDDWNDVYPMICEGDTVLVTWTVTDLCDTTMVSASFGVSAVLDLVVSDPSSEYHSSCEYSDQSGVESDFDDWFDAITLAIQTQVDPQGCDPQVSDDWNDVYPMICEGDTVLVTWTVTDLCDTTMVSASFGVSAVQDLVVSDPSSEYHSSCEYSDQSGVESDFDDWFDAITLAIQTQVDLQGCDPQVSDDWNDVYPMICEGDTVLVTWTVTDLCDTTMVSASFGVSAVLDLVVSDPSSEYHSSCEYSDQSGVESDFDDWFDAITLAIQTQVDPQGCDPQVSDDWNDVYPMICEGDTVLVTWTVTDLCDTTMVSASFGVSAVQDLVVSDPSSEYHSSCEYSDQSGVESDFDDWFDAITLAIQTQVDPQGCDPQVSDDWNDVYPMICEGDTVLVTWTVTDLCDTTMVSASFGVSAVQDLVVSDPSSEYHSSCEYSDQSGVESDFDDWFDAITLAIQTQVDPQGCDPQVSDDWNDVYPMICEGDTVLVTWTVTDLCDTTMVSASFGVSAVQDLVVSDPSSEYHSSCEYSDQSGVESDFDDWFDAITLAIQTQVDPQGCDPQVSDDWNDVYPSICEGDTVLVTWTITDLCDTTMVSASFGVTARDSIKVSCNNTLLQCGSTDIQGAYDAWVAGFTYEGGCAGMVQDNIAEVPPLSGINLSTGGTLTFKYWASDYCTSDTITCTFTLPACEECGTAYGVRADSVCFMENDVGYTFSNWGWANWIVPAVSGGDSVYTLDLYEGNSSCLIVTPKIGEAVVTYAANGDIIVEYTTFGPYYMSQIHVNLNCEGYPFAITGSGSASVSPGQYSVNITGLNMVTHYTITIPHELIDFSGDGMWLIAHAVSCHIPGTLTTDYVSGSYTYDDELITCKVPSKSAEIVTLTETKLAPSSLKVYPNPFTEKVTFEFVSAVDAYGTLEIYNITGQRVARILDRQVLSGEMNRVEYEPTHDATGIYLYKLNLDGKIQVGRIIYRSSW
ncbi:T9SS type A sorting domain-containing protein [Maribellus sp. CM-23]|uniref:T9SS type A sorting domain-containing protein n=1 Tax=Maribellus sp. CM-23 TaxID=2781026 RepID=UPI001F237BCD|nr:T9SS type A sorting domain-containing protein [Maribellus sp. CM-23]MCE4566299.1 T9SS type A sorting domain-containing protein [Maribellus sp. CM-23]